MKLTHTLLIIIFAICMGFGQLLLKFSAGRQVITSHTGLLLRIYALFTDWAFISGAILYGVMLVYWVWLLTFLPLSRAYPFTFISLFVSAIGSSFLFNEPLTAPLVIGLCIIGVGLGVLSTAL